MIKIGIVGCGYWGPNLIRNFHEIDSCEVKYICDTRPEKLKGICKKYPSIKGITDYRDMLKDKEVNAIVLATPVSTHYQLAKKALLNDKHVLIEKPLATNIQEAKELIALAKKKKKILMVGHTFLYTPAVLKVKELIINKTVGDIYYIDSSRVNLGLFQPDVSVVWDLGPHDISIILYWLDEEPIEVHATGSSFIQKNINEVAFITLKFKSGVTAHIHISWLAPCKLRRTTVVGAKSMVVYDDTESVEKVKIYDQGVIKNPENYGEFQLTYRAGDVVSPRLDTIEPLQRECLDFISSIQTGKEPKSNSQFGLKVVKVLEYAERSIKNNGLGMKIPR